MNISSCYHCPHYYYWLKTTQLQNRSTAPLPWIGLYIARASAVCFLAQAADAVQGFCTKKPWIPCKYFAINAVSLTLLAVAVKLPMDLTTSMPFASDQLLKLSSIVLLCTSMSYTIPSLASMTDTDLLLNIVALGILVVTLLVNVVIQMYTGIIGMIPECSLIVILILFQFVVLCFSALTVPTTEKILEHKYKKMQNLASQEVQEKHGNHSVQKLEECVIISWVMAVTGSPQFVMARSVTSSISIVICILSLITLVEATIFGSLRWSERHPFLWHSDYGWSVFPTFLIHYMIICSTMALLAFRFWFAATNFKEESFSNLGDRFKVEQYWIQHLREWKERPLTLPIRSKRCRKLIQDTRNLILNIAIKFQIVIVLLSKLTHLFSSAIIVSLWSCFFFPGRLKSKISNIFGFSNKHKGAEAEPTVKELELGHYVLLLEGEAKLSERALKNIYISASDFINRSRRQCPQNLLELLQKSTSFKGLLEIDSDEVGCTNFEEPLNCWTLPIVNLTSIAIAFPNVRHHKTEWLLKSVSEGLTYARLVEKSPDMN